MKSFPDIYTAIQRSKQTLYDLGLKIESKSWQGKKGEYDTLEILNHIFNTPMPAYPNLVPQIRPNLPWADMHFEERVSGIPHNPPPSHEIWPFAKAENKDHMVAGVFSHTYPERFWPKRANVNPYGMKPEPPDNKGIRYAYGDIKDLVELLKRDPTTRQAYLPVWFPEDTGAPSYQRVPCTLGYHFIQRFGYMHMTYYIRSCDIVRHFRDDIYLAMRLLYWILDHFNSIKPGLFTMHITSLHCFWNERSVLLKDKT
jgi:hypothetical protein